MLRNAQPPKAGPHYELRWGGSAAGFRLNGHYRGERTVAHIRPHPEELLRQLRAVPDPAGNLVIMDAFGTVNWAPDRDTVLPLLVYSEMLSERSERAREAAREVFEQHVEDRWEHEQEAKRPRRRHR